MKTDARPQRMPTISRLLFSARALVSTKTIFIYGNRLRKLCEQDHDPGYEIMKRITEVETQCLQAMLLRLMECTNAAASVAIGRH